MAGHRRDGNPTQRTRGAESGAVAPGGIECPQQLVIMIFTRTERPRPPRAPRSARSARSAG